MTLKERAQKSMENGNIDGSQLVDIEQIGSLSGNSETKLKAFIEAVKNPYLFRVGNTIVHLEFSEQSTETLQDKMCNILLKSIG